MNLFYSALEAARYSPKEPDAAMELPEYLAQVTVNVKEASERIKLGQGRCKKLLDEGSMNDLYVYLPVFAEFFKYIY